MQGITLAVAQEHGIADKVALHAITSEKVAEIYRLGYWRFDGVIDQRVATKLFDMAVNMGLKTVLRMTQKSLNDLGAGLVMDGLWGPRTQASINAVHPDQMLDILCQDSASHYNEIVKHRPTSMKFLRGWMKRAVEVPT